MPNVAERAPVRLAWASLSETGMRDSNEDALGDAWQDDMACFAVADGAGGHEGGAAAAKIVVGAVLRAFLDECAFGTRALLSYVGQAQAGVAQARAASPQLAAMSATVAALLVDQSNACAVWAHLGDTRVYLFRAGRVHALTRDHSLAQQLVDAGCADAGQLRNHPQRNVLFAAVGADSGTPAAPSDGVVPLADGDAFLICTDGLWEWVLEADMERLLQQAPTVEQWLGALCRTADANSAASGKARDNYSAYAIRVACEATP